MDASLPDQTAGLRMQEQVTGSSAVGVSQVEFLEYPDGVLVYSLEMRRDIARAIRRYRPEAALTGSWEEAMQLGQEAAEPSR